MSSKSIVLYNSKIADDYESDIQFNMIKMTALLMILNVVLMFIQIILMKLKQNIHLLNIHQILIQIFLKTFKNIICTYNKLKYKYIIYN